MRAQERKGGEIKVAKLTKIEKELLKEIDKNPYLHDNEIPYKRGQLAITHKAACTDPIALFRSPTVICYGGKFRGKEFVAFGDTDEGFAYIAMAVVSKNHSIIVKKAQKWVRRDTWLRRLLPPGMILEVLKVSIRKASKRKGGEEG